MMQNLRLKYFRFDAALQREDWLSPAYIGVDDNGLIQYLSNKPDPHGSGIEAIVGYALPGFQNAHSHAFQYAMAGLAESHPAGQEDDFWTWREAMYQCVLTMNPDQMEAVAAMLYAEMLRHGYTHVAEFHYLHHDKDGRPYSNLSEMGERILSAAKMAGIKVTLVPVFYQQGGFGQPPQNRQRRFISQTTEDYFKILEASKSSLKSYADSRLGFSVHSLRAVKLNDVIRTAREGPADLPFHLHAAEQKKEVDDCFAHCKKRPVEWLLENLPLDGRFNIVHATHLTDAEVSGLAVAGVQVVLCPSTEGNLGDGIFRMRDYYSANGRWCIGTDSHIGLNPWEEFRMIDYRQRLVSNKRNTFRNDAAKYLVGEEVFSGRRAMGLAQVEHFAFGKPLDAVVIDGKSPLLAASSPKNLLPTMLFTGDVSCHLGTLVNGRWIIRQQLHARADIIRRNFVKTLHQLESR